MGERWYSAEGRIRRSTWAVRVFGGGTLLVLGIGLFAVLLPHGGGAHEARSLFTIPLLLGALGFFVFRIIQDIKRLHDIGASDGWIVCAFIPVISLVYIVILLFRDGEPMTNTYGPDPKGRGSDLDADAVADVFR